jgi:hypothetical protein
MANKLANECNGMQKHNAMEAVLVLHSVAWRCIQFCSHHRESVIVTS